MIRSLSTITGLALLLACSDEPDLTAPSLAVGTGSPPTTMEAWVDSGSYASQLINCTGEWVYTTTDWYRAYRVVAWGTDSVPFSAPFHVNIAERDRLNGYTESGDRWLGNEQANFQWTMIAGDVTTAELRFTLVGQGQASDLRIRALQVFSLTPEGTLAVARNDYVADCSQ